MYYSINYTQGRIMTTALYNPLFLQYFRDFINWVRNHKEGAAIDVFHVSDDMIGELLYAFYKTFSREDRLNPGSILPPSEKNYKKFKARVVLDGGDRSARFEYPSKLLYVTEHGEKRIIITDKMAEIYSQEQNDSLPDLDNCLKRAFQEFLI